jgi:two-component system, NarL family, sensor histidine kinase UhpB
VRLPRPSTRVSILWRVFTVNAIVFGLAVFVLIASPATVSNPIKRSELVALVAGLVVTLAIDLILLMLVLSPLRRLVTLMGDIDPMRPGRRAPVREWMSTEIIALSRAFNTMLDRVETERRESARRALAAQEAERLRIARELHDEIGQTLTAVALQAERAAEDETVQPQALQDIGATVQSSLQDVRRIARELRPEALDDLGLTDALISLCLRIERQGGLRIVREIAGSLPALSTEVELVVYRVAQEALTNALRHSGASQVRVTLSCADRALRLSVVDDGRGLPDLDPETIESMSAMHGIEGMRERAILVHADLQIDSTPGTYGTGPGAGVTVVLTVPLQEPDSR